MKNIVTFLISFLLFTGCEIYDFILNPKSYSCSSEKMVGVAEGDSVVVEGGVFFSGDTIRTDTVDLFCKDGDILSVSRKMNAYHMVQDSTRMGLDVTNIKGSPYKLVIVTKREGISQRQLLFAQGILPKGKVGYTLTNTGDVLSRNPFLRDKRVVTTDKLPKSEIQRIHNTARDMKKETSYPVSGKTLKQYTGNGLYYIGEKNGMIWGVWIIGNVVPPKGDIS